MYFRYTKLRGYEIEPKQISRAFVDNDLTETQTQENPLRKKNVGYVNSVNKAITQSVGKVGMKRNTFALNATNCAMCCVKLLSSHYGVRSL